MIVPEIPVCISIPERILFWRSDGGSLVVVVLRVELRRRVIRVFRFQLELGDELIWMPQI